MAKAKQTSSVSVWIVGGVVVVIFLILAGGLVYLLSTDTGGGRKERIANVELIKPPPPREPPPLKEKLPEPESPKKVIEAVPQMAAPSQAQSVKGDGKPVAEGPLGLDAEGGAGADGFGLAGRKGQGRDIVTLGTGGGGGGYDKSGAMRRFARYYHVVQDALNKEVRRRLDERGEIPKGKLEAEVKVLVDDVGMVSGCRITRSSGNKVVDEVVNEYLKAARLEPPPPDMPRSMSIKFTYQITSMKKG